jgi:hypothetical protein
VADVRHVLSFENLTLYLWEIVPFVKAQVLLTPELPGSGYFDYNDVVKRFRCSLHVMYVD